MQSNTGSWHGNQYAPGSLIQYDGNHPPIQAQAQAQAQVPTPYATVTHHHQSISVASTYRGHSTGNAYQVPGPAADGNSYPQHHARGYPMNHPQIYPQSHSQNHPQNQPQYQSHNHPQNQPHHQPQIHPQNQPQNHIFTSREVNHPPLHAMVPIVSFEQQWESTKKQLELEMNESYRQQRYMLDQQQSHAITQLRNMALAKLEQSFKERERVSAMNEGLRRKVEKLDFDVQTLAENRMVLTDEKAALRAEILDLQLEKEKLSYKVQQATSESIRLAQDNTKLTKLVEEKDAKINGLTDEWLVIETLRRNLFWQNKRQAAELEGVPFQNTRQHEETPPQESARYHNHMHGRPPVRFLSPSRPTAVKQEIVAPNDPITILQIGLDNT